MKPTPGEKSLKSSWNTLPAFLLNLFVTVPLYLVVLLPSTLIWNVLAQPYRMLTKPDKKKFIKQEQEFDKKINDKFSGVQEIVDLESREFDLVFFGATGYTGRLASLYLAKNYGNKIKWAIAGRSQAKLQKIKDELVKID